MLPDIIESSIQPTTRISNPATQHLSPSHPSPSATCHQPSAIVWPAPSRRHLTESFYNTEHSPGDSGRFPWKTAPATPCPSRVQAVPKPCPSRAQAVYKACLRRVQAVYTPCTGRVQACRPMLYLIPAPVHWMLTGCTRLYRPCTRFVLAVYTRNARSPGC